MQQLMNWMRALRLRTLVAALVLGGLTAGAVAQEEAAQQQDVPSIELETVVEGLTSPVMLTSPPNDDRRFIVDRVGQIYILTSEGAMIEEPFLDVSDRLIEFREGFDERGLLGLAFHPNYQENGRFFVYYSAPLREDAPDDWNHTSVISEFKAAEPEDDDDDEATRADSNVADTNSERILLEIHQPQFNHDGGAITFGPDGYLYIALGDGGGANDVGLGHPPMGHGQDVTSILGNILRIDVDRGWPGYAIPEDNPFFDDRRGVDEIHSWGWRNPWRMSFDRETGDLFVATNGQNLWEAVYIATEPGNYGWNILEGTHCFDPQNPRTVPEECPSEGPLGQELQLPVIEYPHPGNQEDSPVAGNSVIGGYVYRGNAIPELQGDYVFGDWSLSFGEPQGQVLLAMRPDQVQGGELWDLAQLRQLEEYVLGFGQDSDGELYVLTTETTGPTGETGKVYQIVAGDGSQAAGEDGVAGGGQAGDAAADDADGAQGDEQDAQGDQDGDDADKPTGDDGDGSSDGQ